MSPFTSGYLQEEDKPAFIMVLLGGGVRSVRDADVAGGALYRTLRDQSSPRRSRWASVIVPFIQQRFLEHCLYARHWLAPS